MYMVFESLDDAYLALEIIYANMVFAIDSPDLLDVVGGSIVGKDNLTPEKVIEINEHDRHFPIFGRNAQTAEKNTTSGYTTAWAKPRQRATDHKVVFEKPDDALLVGISGYAIEEFSTEWFPPQSTID